MELGVRRVGKVAVLDISGKLTGGDGDAALRGEVDRLLAGGCTHLLLNLAQVPYMDSAGIGEVISTYKKTAAAGGTAKLLNPHKRVYDVLQLVKLNSVFQTFQDEAAALATFD
jgi:anti-sigma B factor antagonist